MKTNLFLHAFAWLFSISAVAESVSYELNISETTLSPAGSPRRVLTINGGTPGPTLRFREGDVAHITVRNHLSEESTSVHWHGLLVPNPMDGVPYITTPPIAPGTSQEYTFPLTHPGTYWYHSHTGLQEQRGMYGSIVVTPREGEPFAADREYVVVLSDWTNEKPHEVMRTLMRGSHYYQVRKGTMQSMLGAKRAGAIPDYFEREKSRMPPMDIADIYYDAFLMNGAVEQRMAAAPGETIRLRIINAGSASYFYLQSATGPLRIVAADGPAVQPVEVERLLIGMAETYDVLVQLPGPGAWEIRATAQDNSGHASLILGDGALHAAPEIPSPNLYNMDEMLEAGMSSMDGGMSMDDDPGEPAERPQAPYESLQALVPTTLPPDAPVRELELRLTGDMERYIWSFNDKTYAEEPTVPVKAGEVLRVNLINDTMMHHPIHLHGHFFRLINQHGERSPLKHTVDVPPMGRRTIEFLADAQGDWLFHCHLLYHMDAGMARVFSYAQGADPAYQPKHDPGHMGMGAFILEGMALHNMTMGGAHMMRGRETYGVHWDYVFGHGSAGTAHGHGEHHGDDSIGEYEIDLFWAHYFGPNLSTTLGYRIANGEGTGNRAFGRVEYRLPYLVKTSLGLDSRADLRAGIAKEFQITPRLSTEVNAEYDTNAGFDWAAYAHLLLNKELSLSSGYHSDHGWGAGLSFRF